MTSGAERAFDAWMAVEGITGAVPEHRFHPTRRWRFDRAWPDAKFAVEIEGLVGGSGGRHQRIDGFRQDCEKYLAALMLGWTVVRVPQSWIAKGDRRIWHPPLLAVIRRYTWQEKSDGTR